MIMKRLTLLFVMTMAICYCHAQLATPTQIGEMLNSGKKVEAVKAATQLYKKNKKNIDLICEISRIFLENNDTEGAMDFALKADAAAKNKSAKVHCLLGDIWYVKDEGGEAAREYAMATQLEPQDTLGYVKYANVYKDKFPEDAIAKLNELKKARPDIDVNPLIARAMAKGNHNDIAAQYFDKCDVNTLAIDDIASYAFAALFGKNDANKAYEIASVGAKKNSKVAVFPRIQFYSLASLSKNEEAIEISKTLFEIVGDSANFLDYQFLGGALNGVGKNLEAIDAFRKALKASPEQTSILTKIAASYSLMKDFDNAIATMNEYFDKVGEKGQTFENYSTLADIYIAKARALEAAENVAVDSVVVDNTIAIQEAFKNAIGAYNQAIAKKSDYFLGYYNKGVSQYAFGDVESAKVSFLKVVELLETAGINKSYLKAAYTYLGNCYKRTEDPETGKTYQEKADAM